MQHLDEGTIHAWLDGALDAAQARQVEAHVAECAACAVAVAEARGLIAGAARILIALDDVPGGVLPERAAAPLASRAPTPVRDLRARRAPRWLTGSAARAAAVLAFLAAGGVAVSRVGREPGGERVLYRTTTSVAAESAVAERASAPARDAPPIAASAPSALAGSTAADAPVVAKRSGRPRDERATSTPATRRAAPAPLADASAAPPAAEPPRAAVVAAVPDSTVASTLAAASPPAERAARQENAFRARAAGAPAQPYAAAAPAARAAKVATRGTASPSGDVATSGAAPQRQANVEGALALRSAPAAISGAPALAGCYTLELAPWSGNAGDAATRADVTLPARVRLSTTAADASGEPGRYRLEPPHGASPAGDTSATWTPLGADSAHLAWSSAHGTIELRVAREGDTLRGDARAVWRDGRVPQSSRAMLTRVSCDPAH